MKMCQQQLETHQQLMKHFPQNRNKFGKHMYTLDTNLMAHDQMVLCCFIDPFFVLCQVCIEKLRRVRTAPHAPSHLLGIPNAWIG